MLETERASLLVEIGELNQVAELRANALEIEAKQLREEMKSLREILSFSEEMDWPPSILRVWRIGILLRMSVASLKLCPTSSLSIFQKFPASSSRKLPE